LPKQQTLQALSVNQKLCSNYLAGDSKRPRSTVVDYLKEMQIYFK